MFLAKIQSNNKGFTLIELLVVIAIIGLLSTISVIALNNARAKARDARRVADIKNIQTAMEMYYNVHGYYPQYLTVTQCSVDNYNALGALKTEGLMSEVPHDPKYVASSLCYNYIGLGQATDYSSTSGIYCNGLRRTDYKWSLLFSTETSNFDFEPATSGYKYCVHGELR